MKKICFVAFSAILALGFVSCDKEEGKQIPDGDIAIIGTWVGDSEETPHYVNVTYNADGSYVWYWEGIHRLKDTGKYTYSDNEIKMTISEYYERDYSSESTELRKVEAPYAEYDGKRTCKINEINEGIMAITVYGDYFMGGDELGFDFTLFREGVNQTITPASLKGTWEGYTTKGQLATRIIIDGNKYTEYSVWGWDDNQLVASKENGNWSVSDGRITITPTESWLSYEIGVDDHNMTVEKYSTVNPQTLEAEKWSVNRYFVERSVTSKVYLGDGKLYLASGVLVKK